jgi:hypothetical protein
MFGKFGQWAMGNGQWAMGNGQWTMSKIQDPRSVQAEAAIGDWDYHRVRATHGVCYQITRGITTHHC